jgi:hypothetical protein
VSSNIERPWGCQKISNFGALMIPKPLIFLSQLFGYGDRSPLGPKQNEDIFSVHLDRQDGSGGSELLGPYSPIS